MAVQRPATSTGTIINNIICGIIAIMTGIVINNQWEMKEWKGTKNEVDKTQDANIIFLKADFTLMNNKQEKTNEDVIELKARMPEQRKRKYSDPN